MNERRSLQLLAEKYEQSVAPVMEDTRKGIDRLATFSADRAATEQKFKEYEAVVTNFYNNIETLERLSNDPLLLKLAKILSDINSGEINSLNTSGEIATDLSDDEQHKLGVFVQLLDDVFNDRVPKDRLGYMLLTPLANIYPNNKKR